jgi:Ser/Thr protein kinase RdoA (MazF antagonist)
LTESAPLSTAAVGRAIARDWGVATAAVVPHHRGMNSLTWLVYERGVVRWVAKSLPPGSEERFETALTVAEHVEAAGIPAGVAVRTRGGRRVTVVDRRPLALLTFVDGVPLTGASLREQQLIGSTLARAHAALRGVDVAGADRFHWVDLDAEHLGIRPWLRPHLAAAIAELDRLPLGALTSGALHSDPAPEAFRLSGSGRCGLIDWAALIGPLMYDLASAVMYVGGAERGRRLVDAYVAEGVLEADEVHAALPAMLRFRWAVQADYFARRIKNDDITGIGDRAENEKGLEDARVALSELSGEASDAPALLR